MKKCKNCKKELKLGKKIWCSNECCSYWHQINRGRDKTIRPENTSIMGAMSELAVCEYFMVRGYDVFRALAPVAKVDVVAVHRESNKKYLIEVKTGARYVETGDIFYSKPANNMWDLLAVYIPEEKDVIIYNSKLKEITLN